MQYVPDIVPVYIADGFDIGSFKLFIPHLLHAPEVLAIIAL
jgi:hypothetical protein